MTQIATEGTEGIEVFPGLFVPETISPDDRLMLASYKGFPVPLKRYLGKRLYVRGVLSYDDHLRDEKGDLMVDEDGALIPCKRVIFQLMDETLVSSTSPAVYKFASETLVATLGRPDGMPGDLVMPVSISVEPQATKSNRQTYNLKVVRGTEQK